MSLVPVTRCITAAQARTLAHKHARKPGTPVVTFAKPKEVIKPIIVERPEPPMAYGRLLDGAEPQLLPRIAQIISACSQHYHISILDIMSKRRTAPLVRCRQAAMYLSKTLTLRSYPEIGRRFGGKDHTTVLHAVRKIEGMLLIDPTLVADINAIKAKLGVQ